jgi:hypothetical protein
MTATETEYTYPGNSTSVCYSVHLSPHRDSVVGRTRLSAMTAWRVNLCKVVAQDMQ